jgi:phage shock protein A
LKKFEDYKGEPNLEREMLNEKNSFENEFVALNSDIQQIRSDNETLYDEIKKKEMKLKKLIKEVEDKDSLIALLQKNIKANEEK